MAGCGRQFGRSNRSVFDRSLDDAARRSRAGGLLPREVVEVLGRAPLADRKQMQLLRLGNKLVLIAVSPTGTDALAEITDPVEVDRLTGYCYQGHPNSSTVAFHKVFKSFERRRSAKPREALNVSSSQTSTVSDLTTLLRSPTMFADTILRRLRSKAAARGALALGVALLWAAAPNAAWAEEANAPASLIPTLLGGPDAWTSPEGLSSTLQVLLLMTIISLAPAVLLMTTCFVRIIVVLGLLRQALGTQQLPPSQVISSITLFLTLLVMSPVWKQVYTMGLRPNGADRRIGRGLDRRRRVRYGSS